MTARMVGTCEACQKNNHNACGNQAACICSFRGHPEIPERVNATPNYRPHVEAQ